MPSKNVTRARGYPGQSSHSKLPVELTDYIIDLLHCDIRSLKACALTSRTFLPRARYHLFRSFTLQRKGRDPYKLKSFPNVAHYIRRVVVRGNLVSELTNSTLTEQGLVESLHFVGSEDQWKDVQWTLCRSQFPKFPRLKELSLSRVYFRSLGEMITTLQSLRELHTLSLDFEDVRYTNLPPRIDLSVLETIRIPLRSLHMKLNFLNSAPGKVPQVLLDAAGASLRHLSLEVLSSPQRAACEFPCLSAQSFVDMLMMPLLVSILEHLDFSRCTSLESLTIHLPWYISRNPWVTMVSQDECQHLLEGVISQIHSRSLLSINFLISFPMTSHYNNGTCWQTRTDLSCFDTLVRGPTAARKICGSDLSREDLERMKNVSNALSEVTLELSLPSSRLEHQAFEIMKRRILGQLPTLSSRGVLRIVEGKTVS